MRRESSLAFWILGAVVFLVLAAFAWHYVFHPLWFAPRCVAAGTLIETPDGPRPIESMRAGDAVWCLAPDGSRVCGRVTATYRSRSTDVWSLKTAGGLELQATSLHPIGTARGWVPLGELRRDDRVMTGHGLAAIESVLPVGTASFVHDLDVEPHSNYLAGRVWVHRKSPPWRSAEWRLRDIASSQEYLRNSDLDGNRLMDYWVGDVAQLYYMSIEGGRRLQLIDRSLADADGHPIAPRTVPTDVFYAFAAIPLKADNTPYDQGAGRNSTEYAFCAYPIKPIPRGSWSLIMREDGRIWRKKTGVTGRVLRWPSDPGAEGWQ